MTFPWFKGNSENSVLEEKRKLERELDLQVKAYKRAERHINGLTRAYEDTASRFQQASIENKSMVRQHADEITALTMEHSRSMTESMEKYESAMDSKKQEHIIYVQSLETNHGREVSQLQQEISKLVGQLLVNQDDNQGWPDDKLKLKFRELQRLIDSVTSPRNKEFLIPPNQQLGSHLDPTNFLGRVGRGRSHFLLKSVIWAIFHEQFFSAPFGFGALGPGKAQRELLGVYFTWRKLFDERTGTASGHGDDFAIFHQDKLANKWRSANFQCINATLTASNKSNRAPDSPIAKLSAENVEQTVYRIMSVLSEVSRLSNSLLRSEMEDEIRHMANLAREIAMQFGIHSAQLRLSVPPRGTQIEIGQEFHDCEDGDCYRGTICRVDLVIVPGLQKIGDGRSNMTSKQTITPCEIYPDEPRS